MFGDNNNSIPAKSTAVTATSRSLCSTGTDCISICCRWTGNYSLNVASRSRSSRRWRSSKTTGPTTAASSVWDCV